MIPKQQGAVLFVSLVMVTIMTLMVLAALDTSLLETRISANTAMATQSFASAEELLASAEKTIGHSGPPDSRHSVKHLGCYPLSGQVTNRCNNIYEVDVIYTDPQGGTNKLKSYVSTTTDPNSSDPSPENFISTRRLAWIDL